MKRINNYVITQKRKRMTNVIGILVICCAMIVIVKCVLEIMPVYALWQYENKISYLDITPSQTPSFVTVQIAYSNKAPTDIKVKADDRDITDHLIWDYDMNHNIINFSFDANVGDQRYTLQLLPQDNYEMQYRITESPSYTYMTSDIQAYTSAEGERWLMIHASYPRTTEPFYVSLYFEGVNYQPVIMGHIMNGDTIYLNIDKLVEDNNINIGNVTDMHVYIGQEITDEDAINIIHVYTRQSDSLDRCFIRADARYNIHAWPPYNESLGYEYDLSYTYAFEEDVYNRSSVEDLQEITDENETEQTEQTE